MGQSTSSPQRESRDNAQSQENESPQENSQLRRSRRIRNHLSQLSDRLGSIASRGVTSNRDTSTGRNSSLRIRSRIRSLSNRSPLAAATSGRRSSPSPRIRFSLSRPLGRSEPIIPTEPATDTPISGGDPFMGAADDPMPIDLAPVTPPEPPRPEPPPSIHASPRRSRMSRPRSSITTTLPNLFAELAPRRHSHAIRHSSSLFDYTDSDIDGEMELDSHSNSNTTNTSPTSRNSRPDFSPLGNPSQADLTENTARARPGEDQAAMLSRLLSVAAAMTAASLVGSSEQAFTEAQDVAGDNGDNSFESFLRALQNGRLAAALRNGGNEMGGGVPTDNENASTAPLNFFRMFRFGASPATAADTELGESPPTRMVPVIIVGIRSVTPRDNGNHNNNATPTPPFLDALANIPMTPPPTFGSNRTNTRSRLLSSQRRASIGAVGGESSRSHRRARPVSEILFPSSRASETAQGPYAPPSTPAEPSLLSSGDGVRSPEQANRTSETLRNRRHSTPPVTFSEPSNPNTASGIRGNNAGSSSASNNHRRQEGTRSWIIYVLGGSYPENHPILTTPSLFTDTPTYEDMMLLSSLLGPAKPPVASQDDVNSAGGLFTVGDTDNVGENGTIRRLPEGDRCLVCLCDFEKGEQCRSLVQCQHIFHKECIDEWLTTGRNSCPLCRAQGVQEKEKRQRPPDQTAQPTATVNIS